MEKNAKLLKTCGWIGLISCILLLLVGEFIVAIGSGCLAYVCFSGLKKNGDNKSAGTSVKSSSAQPRRDVISRQNSLNGSQSTVSSRSISTAKSTAAVKESTEAKIEAILSTEFSGYTVRRNADFASLTSEWWVCSCGAENMGSFCSECGQTKADSSEWTCQCGCRNRSKFCSDCGKTRPAPAQYEPINFLLMKDGFPVLAILLVTRRRWNHKIIRLTMEACEAAGIPCQRYFEEFENDRLYVTDRIRSVLR